MGLLSFLRRENDRLSSPLRAQAYHSTAPQVPPLRGTYPVSGTSSPRFEPLFAPRRVDPPAQEQHRSEVQPNDHVEKPLESHAPAPLVPRFKEFHLTDRPSTARSSRSTSKGMAPVPSGTSTPVHTGGHVKTPSWLKLDSLRSSGRKPQQPHPLQKSHHARADSSYSAAAQRAFDEFADEPVTFEPNPAVNPPRLLHTRHVSLQNIHQPFRSQGGFVDILDAQSEIKPADFRSRVKATGVRDYGEDVADRNISVSRRASSTARPQTRDRRSITSPSLETTPVHLRRLPPSPQVARFTEPPPVRYQTPRPKTSHQPGSTDEDPYRRTRSLNSSSFAQQFPFRGEGLSPRVAGVAPSERKRGAPPVKLDGYSTDFQTSRPASSGGPNRRQALSIYNPQPGGLTSPSRAHFSRSGPMSHHPGLISSPEKRPASAHRVASANDLGMYGYVSHSRGPTLSALAEPASHPEFPKISTVPQGKKKKKKKKAPPTPSDLLGDHPRLQDTRRPSAPPRDMRSYEPFSDGDDCSPPAIPTGAGMSGMVASKRHSITSQTADFFVGGGRPASRDVSDWVTSGGTYPPPVPGPAAGHRRELDLRQDIDRTSWRNSDRTMTMPAAPSPHIVMHGRDEPSGRPSTELAASYERTRSLVSMREHTKSGGEIYDYIPLRTSSLRNWSMLSSQSTVPTTAASVTSSSAQHPHMFPFAFPPRPHTSHTADTSVDLPVFPADLKTLAPIAKSTSGASTHSNLSSSVMQGMGSSGGGGGGDSLLHSPITSGPPTIEEHQRGHRKTGSFNIDDYLSSEDDDDDDADSFVAQKLKPAPPSVGEEALLFNDFGYGAGGLQLPGLFEAIPESREEESSGGLTTSQLHRHSRSGPTSPMLGGSFFTTSKRNSMMSSFSGRSGASTARPFASIATGYDSGLLSEDDDDFLDDLGSVDLDVPGGRADLAPGRRGAKRISALGTMYGAIEEERFEIIDIRDAVRRRKEAKQRKRDLKRAVPGRARQGEVDEGNLADGEEAC